MPERDLAKAPATRRSASCKLVLEKKAAAAAAAEDRREEAGAGEAKVEQPKPPPPKPEARERAQNAGLLGCRTSSRTCATTGARQGGDDQESDRQGRRDARSERTLITSQAARQRRHQHRQPEPRLRRRRRPLSGHTHHAGVLGDVGRAGDRQVERGAGSGKASRSEEEIEMVFDRNKGAIYALYRPRAAREAGTAGQGGAGAHDRAVRRGHALRVVSSELNDPELERKIVARISCSASRPRTSSR